MRCPYCGSTNTQVKDSRPSEDHTTRFDEGVSAPIAAGATLRSSVCSSAN